MTKQKTKLKKSTLWKNIILLVALALALTAFTMSFFEMVVAIDGSASYKGNEVVFGYYELGAIPYVPPGDVYLKAVWAFSFGNFPFGSTHRDVLRLLAGDDSVGCELCCKVVIVTGRVISCTQLRDVPVVVVIGFQIGREVFGRRTWILADSSGIIFRAFE